MRSRFLSNNDNGMNIFSQLEAYFENFWEPIIILDSEFRINQANRKFLELCGYSKDELLNESPSKVLDQFTGVFPIHGNLKLNITSFEGKITYAQVKSKYGIELPVKMTFQPFYRDIEIKEWFIAIFIRDISHEVHLKRQLNATKEYALNTNQISGIIYRQTELGPTAWVRDKYIPVIYQRFPDEHEVNDELIRIGLVLTTALGQGSSYTLGLSELPIADYDIVAICFTTFLEINESKGRSYVIVTIFFPKKLESLIEKRVVLEKIFEEHFKNVHNFDQLTLDWLYDLKKDLLQFDDGITNA